MNVLWTSILDSVLLLLLPIFILFGSQSIYARNAGCDDCDAQFATAFVVLTGGSVTAFLLTVGVSVLLLVRRTPATAVPVAGAFALVVCAVVSSIIAQ